jgi:pilus assembly protein Flp/PilA
MPPTRRVGRAHHRVFGHRFLHEDPVMFSHVSRRVLAFVRSEDGPTAVEYAVMLALIIVVCITAVTTLGGNSNNSFSYVGTKVGRTSS